MGPRFDERGNPYAQTSPLFFFALQWGRASMSAGIHAAGAFGQQDWTLQWGRASMSAEMTRAVMESIDPRLTSMGPRFDERGNKRQPFAIKEPNHTSMGPRFDERGNSGDPFRPTAAWVLQWGRASMSAEMSLPTRAPSVRESLQWGRASMSAEMGQVHRRRAGNEHFNGAALR